MQDVNETTLILFEGVLIDPLCRDRLRDQGASSDSALSPSSESDLSEIADLGWKPPW